MNKNSVKYIGFYDLPHRKSKRVSNLAAINKMDYITNAINRAGYNVDIISPSWISEDSEIKFELQKKVKINSKTNVIFFPSWKTKNFITRNLKILWSPCCLFFYLIFKTKRNEKVFVYHVPWISIPIRAAKKIKNFQIVLEVEEIYGDVWKQWEKFKKIEQKLIDSADTYILVSDLLKEHLNKDTKSSIVLYGSYHVIPIEKNKVESNNQINLLYAGSIDITKGGAYNAIEALRYLPDRYILNIIGHGSSEQISNLLKLIKSINEEKGKEVCIFDGTLHGQKYTDYLLKCDIALNPQNQGDYMNTAFPSKILSYLSHNLRVVSTEIKSVKNSAISNYINFSQTDDPESIAEAILNVNCNINFDSRSTISKLDKKFVVNIKELMSNNNV